MKNIKRTLALLLTIAMVLTMLPLAAVAEDQSPTPTEPQWPNQGAINLSKTATSTGNPNEYLVELKIQGKNYHTSSDVVLVIDNSNSMYDDFSWRDDRNRMDFTKLAAKAFADQLLTEGSDTRIALVVYGTTVHSYTGFYTATTKADLITAIEAISQNSNYGGTNQQAGIHKAQELLSSEDSTGVLKNIVILSDGMATYSYPFVGGTGSTDCRWIIFHSRTGTPSVTWPTTPAPDYSARIGEGDDFSLRSGNIVWDLTCNDHNTTFEDVLYGSFYYDENGNFVCSNGAKSSDNGVATIWEANQAKAAGTTVYSVAFQAGDDGEATLKSCATDSTKGYFAISSSETDVAGKLNTAFTAIAGSIAIAASQGVVSDPMSEYVTMNIAGAELAVTSDEDVFTAGNADLYISQGTASWDDETKTISWNVGNINEDSDAVMRYRVTLKNTVQKGQTVPTNGTTTFSYKNYQGRDTVGNFDVPEVTVDGGAIRLHFYQVNADGQPVNSEGTVVESPQVANQLATATYYEVNGSSALDYGTYSIAATDITNYTYYGYTFDGTADSLDGTTTPVSVTLTATNATRELWFAYQKGFQIVHVQDGVAGKPVSYPITEKFNITKEVSEGYLYGGTFDEPACAEDNIHNFGSENPIAFTPEANKTYYIWEVKDTYLMPKSYRVWGHPIGHNGAAYVTQLHLLTSVDRELYAEVGFDYDNDVDDTNIVLEDVVLVDELAETVESYQSGALYDQLYVDYNGSLASSHGNPADESDRGIGYIGIYSLNAVEFAAFESAPLYYRPYWITLDGVKVTNDAVRSVEHLGEGSENIGVYPLGSLPIVKYVGTLSQNARSVMAVYMLDYDAAPAAPVEPDEPAAVTVTVHDGDTYAINAQPGSSIEVEPKGAEGKLFAGWYADEAFAQPADLTDVQEDTDIYAKYVSDLYLQVKCINAGMFNRGSLRLISALDSKDYLETGFVVNGEKLVVSRYTSSYLFSNAKTLFGVGRNDPLMTTSYAYRGLRRGDTLEIQAYWITPDGTTVYGDARTLTYGRFGLED